MIDGPIGLAFVAGTVAAFNPCGFALLPGYLAYYLGGDGQAGLGRAAVVAGSVSAGFGVVFLVIGAIVVSVSSSVLEWAPWAGIVIGIAMVPLGLALANGMELKVRVPGVGRVASGTGPAAMFGYGVVYALASLACTIPAFLVTVSATFSRTNFLSGLVVFGAYAVGMALVLTILTVAVALAKGQLVTQLRRVLPHAQKVAGWLVVVAGLYVIYYGWFQLQIVDGDPVVSGPAELVAGLSEPVSRFVGDLGFATLVLGLAALVVVAVVVRTASGSSSRSEEVNV